MYYLHYYCYHHYHHISILKENKFQQIKLSGILYNSLSSLLLWHEGRSHLST